MSSNFNQDDKPHEDSKKISIKKLREMKLKSLKTEKKLNEILTKLSDAPESFFSEISSIASTLNSFSKEYKYQIFDTYVSALNGTQKLIDTGVAHDNTFDTHFELFVESFNLLLNEKNKNDEPFIFVLFRNHKYDLIMRLLRLCVKNNYRLDLNLYERDEESKSLNFVDMLISHCDSINSIVDKNINYKKLILFNNVNYNKQNEKLNNEDKSYDERSIENQNKAKALDEQVEKERTKLNKIHSMLNFILENADNLIKIKDDSEDYIIKKEKDKINFHLNITNNIRNLETLFENNILHKGRKIRSSDLDELLLYINTFINSQNFEHFRRILFEITRSLIYYEKAEEVLYILKNVGRIISKDSLFRFTFDLKNTENELLSAEDQENVVFYNRFKLNHFSFQGNGSLLGPENLFDLLILNNHNHIHSDKRGEILEFILTSLRDDPIYIKNFCDIYCAGRKNKAFFKSLGVSNSFSLSAKMDLLVKIDSLVNDNKNYLRSLGETHHDSNFNQVSFTNSHLKGLVKTPNDLNFFQISFTNLRYFLREIDLDSEQGLQAFRSILEYLNLSEIKSQVETKFNRRDNFDKAENLLQTFLEIDPQNQSVKDKRLIRIYNKLKPELACWIRMQNTSRKLDNILREFLYHNLLDFEPFYIKKGSIRNMYNSFTPFTKISLLETINSLCKQNKITMDQKNIKTIIIKVLRVAQDNSYRLTKDENKLFKSIYMNVMLCDFIDLFNLHVLKNSEFLHLVNNNNQELNMLVKSVLIFLGDSIKIATEIKKDPQIPSILNSLTFLNSSLEANFIESFKKSSLNDLENFSNNFSKVIFGSLSNLIKTQLPEFENSYFYYDINTSSTKLYKRKLFSQSFLSENRLKDSNNGLNFIKDFVEKSSLLEATWNTDFESLNRLQKFTYTRLIRDNSFKGLKDESENFLFNLFNLYENNLENYELKFYIRNLLNSFLFNLMKKENFFKTISFLLNKLNREKFPNGHRIFLDFLEEILKENFNKINENHVSVNYGPSSIYYSGTSDKNYFFEFVYFIFRDFILTDFNTDEANFSARFRIMNLLAQFLKKMRNQEFYEYFNIAIYYVFKLNFLKQKKSFSYQYKFETRFDNVNWMRIKTLKMVGQALPHKQPLRKLGLTNVAFDCRTAASRSQYKKEKIRFDFKKLSADNSTKTKTKIKSLGLILLYKLNSIGNKDNLQVILSVYRELRSLIVDSENLLNYDLKNKFSDLFLNEYKNVKQSGDENKVNNGEINSSLFITGGSMEELIKNNSNVQSNENSEHQFIEDYITKVEIYDTLFNMLSEYFCYFDSGFFRDYFKNIFYRLNIMKLDDNVNNSVITHLIFFDFQINEFCRNILPSYIKLKQDLKQKIECLPADAGFSEFFKSHLKSGISHPTKTNYINLESNLQLEKATDTKARKAGAKAETETQQNYKFNSKFTSEKYYLDISDSKLEANLLMNGICPDGIRLPSFFALRFSEENRKLNRLVKEFNSKIKFLNYVFAPVVNVNVKSERKNRRILLKSDLNELIKNTYNFACSNKHALQAAFIELNLKKFGFNSDTKENVFLNLPFHERLGHNLILNIIKDDFVYTDNFSVQKQFSVKNSGLNRDNFLSFLDFNEKIIQKLSKNAYCFSLNYNPFSMVLHENSSAHLLKSYTETLIKLDQLASNFSYREKSTDLNAFLSNFFPANFTFKLTDKKPIEAIDLLIDTANILGVSENRKFLKDFEYDCFAFETNISIITECFRNNSDKVNKNGVAFEALCYVIEVFLRSNDDLERIINFIPSSKQGNKEFVHLKCSKKSKNEVNLVYSDVKDLKRNVQETLNCHATILSDFLDIIDFKETQNQLTLNILSLLIKKALHLINLQIHQDTLNKGAENQLNNNSSDHKASKVEAFYKKLLKKTVNTILPSNLNKKDSVILHCLWQSLFDLLELNVKILNISDKYCIFYYDCVRKVILSDDSEKNYNAKFFKNQLLSKPHKFLLLAMSIQFNDGLVFEKLLSMTQAGILYETLNLESSILSEYIYKSKSTNTISHNLHYCHSNKLNAFYLLLLNHQNKSQYYSFDYNYDDVVKHLNFEVVFTEENNVLKKLGLPNPLRNILTNWATKMNVFGENYIQESEKILEEFSYEKEVEKYLDFVFVNFDYFDQCYAVPEDEDDPDNPKYVRNRNKVYISYDNEKAVYEKLRPLLTVEENKLFSNQSENTKIYFNFHKYIVYLISSKRFEDLENLTIYNKKAADFILKNQNFYLRIFAKYVKSYQDLDKLLRYLRTSELFVEKDFDYFALFFHLVKLNNTNILNAIMEENNLLAEKLNLESIFTQEELSAGSAKTPKDSIKLDNNFTKNRKLKFLIFNSVFFNSKDLLFFILDKITGKSILEELIDFNSTVKLTVKNSDYEISISPKYLELALNKGCYEMFFVLLRLIKYDENWSMIFYHSGNNDRWLTMSKIDLIIAELFEKKNANLLLFVKNVNKPFLGRLTYLYKIKLYLDKLIKEEALERMTNFNASQKDHENKGDSASYKAFANSDSFEIQNCLIKLFNNRIFTKNILFSDNKANEYLGLEEFINLISDLPIKVFKIIIILFFLVFKIKPMNLDYFHDFIYTHMNGEINKKTNNFLIFISLLEKILKQESHSFIDFKDAESANFDSTLKIISEIQNQTLDGKLNSILLGDNDAFTLELERKNSLTRKYSQNSDFSQELEDEFRIFLNQNSALGPDCQINICHIENESIIDYAKDFYNSIKENMFTYNIYKLFAKEGGKVKLLMYEFLDSSKPNSLESFVNLDLMSNMDWSTLVFEQGKSPKENEIMLSDLNFLFRELFSFENLFLRQILKNLSESETNDINSSENQIKSASIIEYFEFCVNPQKSFEMCVNKFSIEFSDKMFQLLKNIEGANLSVMYKRLNETLQLLELNLHPNTQKPECSLKQKLLLIKDQYTQSDTDELDLTILHQEYNLYNLALESSQNVDLLMHLLLFDPKKFMETQQNYFADLRFDQSSKEENDLELVDFIKEQKNIFKTISSKLLKSLFDEKKENNLFRKTLNDIIKNGNEQYNEAAVRKLFENLAYNCEQNISTIVMTYVTNLNKILSEKYINFTNDIDFEKLFNKDKRLVKQDKSSLHSYEFESSEKNNLADKSYLNFFYSLIVDLEMLIEIFDFYEAVSSGMAYLDIKNKHIEDVLYKHNKDFRVDNSNAKADNHEACFIKSLLRNFNKHLLKLNFTATDRKNESNFKEQLKEIHDHNMNSLSQIIFDPLSFIVECFSEKQKLDVSVEEFVDLISFNSKFKIFSESDERKLKNRIKKYLDKEEKLEVKTDKAEFFKGKGNYLQLYFFLKFITCKSTNINNFTIPIDTSTHFSRLDIVTRLNKRTNKHSKDDLTESHLKPNFIESDMPQNGKNVISEKANLEEVLVSFYNENYNCLGLEDQIINFIENIRITFNSVILGCSDIKIMINGKYYLEQEKSSFFLNPLFYYLVDFYRSKSNDFISFPVTDLSFIKKHQISKDSLDSLFEKVHCVTQKISSASNKKEANDELRLLKRLLNLNIRKGFIEIDTWASTKISPKIDENQKTILTSLIKNYVLLDSLAGKLSDIHAEDLVKLVSILYKKGVENNKAFLKLVPQFNEFLEKFILNKKNFAVKNFSECFSQVFYVDKIKYEANIEKVICPYQSDEPFATFISQIKLFIDVFSVKNPDEPNNAIKFGQNIIQENLERVYLGIDQLIDILDKIRFNLNQPNHEILGIRNLFDTYMCFNSDFLLAENLNENKNSPPAINTIDVDFKFENLNSEVTKLPAAADNHVDQVILGVSKVNLRIEKIGQDNSIDLDFTIIISRIENEKSYSAPLEIEVENHTDFKLKEKLYLN